MSLEPWGENMSNKGFIMTSLISNLPERLRMARENLLKKQLDIPRGGIYIVNEAIVSQG